jgi:hypothetical protein
LDSVLDEIRAGADNALYGAGPDVSEELFAKHVVSLIEGAGLPVLQTMHYRWFLREVARLWRTRTGRDLAFHLELCIRKWVGLGLEPRTLQFLVCEAYERLKAKDLTTKSQRHEENPGGEMPAKTGTVPHAECAEGLSPVFAPDRVPSPDDSTTETQSRSEAEDSIPGPLDSSDPGTLPGIMAGPRSPADPATGSSLTPSSDHSISRSLDPAIPSELP